MYKESESASTAVATAPEPKEERRIRFRFDSAFAIRPVSTHTLKEIELRHPSQ